VSAEAKKVRMITKIELLPETPRPDDEDYGDRGAGCGIRIAIHQGQLSIGRMWFAPEPLLGEMLSILVAISSKTSNTRRAGSAGASTSARSDRVGTREHFQRSYSVATDRECCVRLPRSRCRA